MKAGTHTPWQVAFARLGRGIPLMILVCLMWGQFSVARSEAFRVIQLQHRFAADILPLVAPLLEEGEKATGSDSVLVLRASTGRLAELTDLITALDRPRKTLKISLRQTRAGQTGDLSAGFYRVGPDQFQAEGQRTLGNRQQTTESFLRVLEGETGLLILGREVPFTTAMTVFSGRHRGFSRTVEYKSVTTGFWVRPQVLGNKISLEVAPHMMAQGQQGEETLEFQQLKTTLELSPGQWVDLGQQLQQADEVSLSIVRLQTGLTQGEGRVWIRVDE
ncbi:MAG: hypothetical protein SCI25_15105 [Desulfuromonadales bacterium]|nr:hypothetical protein [Desulfuromonadales bacterium]MDW7756851.1 hypothetical protein [Desulfuromonadales bacterium]